MARKIRPLDCTDSDLFNYLLVKQCNEVTMIRLGDNNTIAINYDDTIRFITNNPSEINIICSGQISCYFVWDPCLKGHLRVNGEIVTNDKLLIEGIFKNLDDAVPGRVYFFQYKPGDAKPYRLSELPDIYDIPVASDILDA